jgi:hypothetical protein
MPNTVETYLGYLTSFHRGQPRFEATVRIVAEWLLAYQEFLADMPRQFDLDVAIGKQLDVLGEWIGRSRYVKIPIQEFYFALDDPLRGLDKGIWKGPYSSQLGMAQLEDEPYRHLLRTKIRVNSWDGTAEQAAEILLEYFDMDGTSPSKFFVENRHDMTLVYGVSQTVPSILDLMILSGGYIPLKPKGVKTYYFVTSINNTPMFGLDVDNEYLAGLDEGSWGVPPDYYVQNPI